MSGPQITAKLYNGDRCAVCHHTKRSEQCRLSDKIMSLQLQLICTLAALRQKYGFSQLFLWHQSLITRNEFITTTFISTMFTTELLIDTYTPIYVTPYFSLACVTVVCIYYLCVSSLTSCQVCLRVCLFTGWICLLQS